MLILYPHVLFKIFTRSRSPANQPSTSLNQRYQAGHDDDDYDDDDYDDASTMMMTTMITWANILALGNKYLTKR